MSVTAEVNIRNRPWRGYDDPSLPSGMYFAWANIAGDVSGGDRIIRVLYETEAAPVTGRHYNIEQLEVFDEIDADAVVGMFLLGCSQFINNALQNRQYAISLLAHENEDTAIPTSGVLSRPIFLGQRDDAAAGMTAQFHAVNSDAKSLFVRVEGYVWEARSVQAPGGLQRPVNSLYG